MPKPTNWAGTPTDISDAVDRDLEARVLDALEPHPTSLNSLSFRNYCGGRFPKWLSALSFPILKMLFMTGLEGLNRMVDVELPSLVTLLIKSCLKLRDVSMGVPNLISLVVSDCGDLTTLSMSPSLGNSSSSLSSSILDLPQLKELTFRGCSSLRDICMVQVPGLEKLWIEDCEELKMIYVDHMPKLRELMLRSLPNLNLAGGLHPGSPSPRHYLTHLPKALITIASLRTLIISDFPELVSFPETGLPPLLQVLRVSSCKNLQYLPTGLGGHTSLRDVFIENCDQVQARPDDPPNFTFLRVVECPKLEQQIEQIKQQAQEIEQYGQGWQSMDVLEDNDISDVDRDLEASVLDALEPHPTSLKSLSFRNYHGGRIPKWLFALSFPILKKLVMEGLDGINRMVDLELPSLERLEILSCLKLKDVSMRVPKLLSLVVLACRDLTTLSMSPSLGNSSSSPALSKLDLPQLKKLTFSGCSSLRDICMVQVPGLKDLQIEDCKELRTIYADHMLYLWKLMLKSLPNLTLLGGLHPGSSSSLTSLKELPISLGCEHELISLAMPAHGSDDILLPKEGGGMFPNIEDLDVQECPKLKFSPEWLCHLTSLESITFSCQLEARKEASLRNLSRLWDMRITGFAGQVLPLVGNDNAGSTSSSLPPKLKKLAIQDCPNLNLLPKALLTIASLQTLIISDCPELVSFPETGLPPLLQVLRVSSCKNLQYLPTGLGGHTSLQDVFIGNCDQVQALSDEPPNFTFLRVVECPKLEQQIEQIKQHAQQIEQYVEDLLTKSYDVLQHGIQDVDDPIVTGTQQIKFSTTLAASGQVFAGGICKLLIICFSIYRRRKLERMFLSLLFGNQDLASLYK